MSFLDKLDEEQLKNANLIADEAKRVGIPPKLAITLAYQESGLRHLKGSDLVTSSKGASGIMQLMPGTARDLNVDPTDKLQNIRGGVAYLKMMMDRPEIKGDPMLAVIAYNAGPDNQFFKGGELPGETKNYLESIKGLGGFDQIQERQEPAVGDQPPTETEYDFQELIIPAAAGAAGAVAGAGMGAYVGKGIDKEQKLTRGILAQIADLIGKGNIDQARDIAQIHFGKGGFKFPDRPYVQSGAAPIVEPDVSLGRASGPKVAGDSGVRNWMIAEAGQRHQLPEAILDIATDKTKESPTGAKRLIEQDVEALKKIKAIGGDGYELTQKGPGQLMLPSNLARPSQQAAQAAQVAQAAQAAEAERNALEQIRRLSSEAQVKSGLEAGEGVLGKVSQAVKQFPIPTGAVMGGLGAAGAAVSGIDAAESYQQNDIPMFVMNALQAIGSGLSAFPATAIPAAIATTGIAGISALEKGRRQEALKNIPAKRRFEAMPEPTPEEIAEVESMGPAMSRRGLGYRFP